jgi:tRNA-2-methylthio-N6-dimethylallyladenosine synthase
MVGFPGETDDDFTETLELIKEIEFDNVFSFKYSDRDGTRASRMENKIDEAVKIERLKILQDTQKQITLKRNRGLEGKIEEVLVDGSSRSGNQMKGRTRTNKIVNFDCDNSGIGDTFNVLIKRGLINSLKGEVTG